MGNNVPPSLWGWHPLSLGRITNCSDWNGWPIVRYGMNVHHWSCFASSGVTQSHVFKLFAMGLNCVKNHAWSERIFSRACDRAAIFEAMHLASLWQWTNHFVLTGEWRILVWPCGTRGEVGKYLSREDPELVWCPALFRHCEVSGVEASMMFCCGTGWIAFFWSRVVTSSSRIGEKAVNFRSPNGGSSENSRL